MKMLLKCDKLDKHGSRKLQKHPCYSVHMCIWECMWPGRMRSSFCPYSTWSDEDLAPPLDDHLSLIRKPYDGSGCLALWLCWETQRAATQQSEYPHFFPPSGFLCLRPIITVLPAETHSRHGFVDVAAPLVFPFSLFLCLPFLSTGPKNLLGHQLSSSSASRWSHLVSR